MSVKIDSMGISDVVIGSVGGGKTNIEKIVVGNADGNGNVVWQRNHLTVGGGWSGYCYGYEVYDCYYASYQYWILNLMQYSAELYFSDGSWNLDSSIIKQGDGSEKILEESGEGIHLEWHE